MNLSVPKKIAALLDDCQAVVAIPMAWGEMDAFQHLNNIIYFRYFETARIAFFEQMKMTIKGLPQGIGPILAATSCRFKAPLTFPDTVYVGARVIEVGEDRFLLEHPVVSEKLHKMAAIGEAEVVSYDYQTLRKAPLPLAWRKRLMKSRPS